MGRKRPVNLRHKTLKIPILMRGGTNMQSGGDKDTDTFLQEKAILETQLILDLSTFKKNIAMLTFNTIRDLINFASSTLQKDITYLLMLKKEKLTQTELDDLKLLAASSLQINSVLYNYITRVRQLKLKINEQIKNLKGKSVKNDTPLLQNKLVDMVKNESNALLEDLTARFSRVDRLKNVFTQVNNANFSPPPEQKKNIRELQDELQTEIEFNALNVDELENQREEGAAEVEEGAPAAVEAAEEEEGAAAVEEEAEDAAEEAAAEEEALEAEAPLTIPNKDITALREEIIDLLEHNPDITIDRMKYGEIEDAVQNWAYTPDAEELEKFKEFKDYLRRQVVAAGENVFGDIAAGDFEDFAQAIQETQPAAFTPPLFVEADKERLTPAEIEDIVRKRVVELEEQYKQDKQSEAEVIAKYEGLIQNMQDEDRAKYQTFIDGIRKQWNDTIQERNVERYGLYKVLTQNEDTIKTLQQDINDKQTALEQNEQLDAETIQNLRTSIDDARQKLREKTAELIKATEVWNETHQQAEVNRREQMDALLTQLQETITQANESKARLENMLAERNALILKGRAELKKQQDISEKLTKRIEDLEEEKLEKEELEKWSKMEDALNSTIQKNETAIEAQEQMKQRLTERIAQLEDDDALVEPAAPVTDSLVETASPVETALPVETASLDETAALEPAALEPAALEPAALEPAAPVEPASIQTTTTKIAPGKNGVQEILVRIQYPPGTINPGPVMSVIGDASVSTEAAVVGVMGEQSSVPVPVPAPEENPLLGGAKIKNKHKTTRRKTHSYFTKDDFINF
jgi:chromosome segregation ATPase